MTTRRRRPMLVLAAVALLLPALAACGEDESGSADTTTTEASEAAAAPEITDVWARQVQDRGAVYMVIEGGDEADALLAASVPADVAGEVQIHETVGGASGGVGDAEDGTGDEGMGEDGTEGSSAGTTPEGGDAMSETTTSMADGSTGEESDETTTSMAGGGMDGGMDGGMMQMREVDQIDVPAGGTVTLQPGGLHIMLLDVQKTLSPGDTFEVTPTFERAGERTVTAEVREA